MDNARKDVFELKEIQKETVGENELANQGGGPKFISRYTRCVVIPVEDLETAKRAISHYLNECQKDRDHLYLFHSVHFDPSTNIGGTSGLFHSEQMRRQLMRKQSEVKILRDNLEKFLTDNDVTATFYARDGERAGQNIVRFSKEKGANLIIMAAKEQSRILNAVVGQTSDYVLKHSCGVTVTVVPPPTHITRTRLQRQDSDTSCPGDLTYGHRRRGLNFLKPTRRRLHSEPSALQVNDLVEDPENENVEEAGDA